MKTRWQKSLEAAVAAYDTPLPWARGARRNEMILRRQDKERGDQKEKALEVQRA